VLEREAQMLRPGDAIRHDGKALCCARVLVSVDRVIVEADPLEDAGAPRATLSLAPRELVRTPVTLEHRA
jgi:hypothetical protein